MSDPLKLLSDEGVAVWLDDMSRARLVSGNLKALVRDKHVVGVTTNPTIFHKAITGTHVYDDQIGPSPLSTSRSPRRSGC
jgi:transaldolase